jgi:hypothetical protein
MLSGLKILKKIAIFLIILIFAVFIASRGKNFPEQDISYGATFSKKHAESLVGEKWRDNFILALDDLKIKKFRIPAYWDEIQPENSGEFDYSDLDWIIEEAEKRNAEIILAIGYRLPRWPECHIPEWAEKFSEEEEKKAILSYMETTVNRYKNREKIIAWQIENEPFLPFFGECRQLEKNFLDEEIALVKKLDNRPIVITDSGELSLWVQAASRADFFGTSLYLNTYSKVLSSYVTYPIGPWFFHLKKNITGLFAKPDKWIVIEMQAEPWGPTSYDKMSEKEKSRTMDIGKFQKIINFGKKTGFGEFYLWGLEWWYWEKENNNNQGLWEEAKKIYSR